MGIKKKLIIYTLIFIGAYATLIIFVIYPTVRDIKKISDTLYHERVDLERKYQRGQLLNKALRKYQEIKPQQDKLSSIFIYQGKELDFVTILEDLAGKNLISQKITLKNSDLKAASNDALSLDIIVEGQYPNIVSYLDEIERLNTYFNIDKVKISSFEQESNGRVKLALSGNVYIYKFE